jgi:hypothetical protein
MQVQEIEQLVSVMPPGTRIEILRITVPERPAAEMSLSDAPTADRQEWTPEEIVTWVRREHGAEGLKLGQWAGMLAGVSGRALKRAAAEGRLVTHAKPTGRDHGARMVSPDAMLAYLRAEGHITRSHHHPAAS